MIEDATITANLSLTSRPGHLDAIADHSGEARLTVDRIRIAPERTRSRPSMADRRSKGLFLTGNAGSRAEVARPRLSVAGGGPPRAARRPVPRRGGVFVKHRPEKAPLEFPRIAIGYAHPDGNASAGPVGRGELFAQGSRTSTGDGQGNRPWTGTTAPTASSVEVIRDGNTHPENDRFSSGRVSIRPRQGVGDRRHGPGSGPPSAGIHLRQGRRLLNSSFTTKDSQAKDLPTSSNATRWRLPERTDRTVRGGRRAFD
jgi:hypothetical protein